MSAQQVFALFDLTPDLVEMPKPEEPWCDWAALEEYAFLYTASESGNNSGIRFMMTTTEAQAWCSDAISRGMLHGTRWAYFYTTVSKFISCHWGTKEPKVVIADLVDNGQWDDRIAAVGLTKISLSDFARVLTPFGVKVES